MAKGKKGDYGEGSIFESPKGSGRYIITVYDGHGKPTTRRATSRQAAEAKRKELIARRDEGLSMRGGSQSLASFTNIWWERGPLEKGLAPKTRKDYRDTIERFLLPDWGMYLLEEFERDAALVLEIHKDLRARFSHATAARAIAKLSMLFNAAVRWRMMRFNPINFVRQDIPTYQGEEGQPLTPEQVARLFATVKGMHFEVLYHVALTYGMRLGELLGLQWGDIDWKERIITVRRQAQEIGGQRSVRNKTKSDAGARKLPIPPRLYEMLRKLWDGRGVSLFLFPSQAGTLMSESNFERHWRGGVGARYTKKDGSKGEKRIKGVRAKAGLPEGITPHDFRHTVGTRLMEMGVPDELRDAIMGHGKKRKRREARFIYSHARVEALRKVLEMHEREMWAAAEGQQEEMG